MPRTGLLALFLLSAGTTPLFGADVIGSVNSATNASADAASRAASRAADAAVRASADAAARAAASAATRASTDAATRTATNAVNTANSALRATTNATDRAARSVLRSTTDSAFRTAGRTNRLLDSTGRSAADVAARGQFNAAARGRAAQARQSERARYNSQFDLTGRLLPNLDLDAGSDTRTRGSANGRFNGSAGFSSEFESRNGGRAEYDSRTGVAGSLLPNLGLDAGSDRGERGNANGRFNGSVGFSSEFDGRAEGRAEDTQRRGERGLENAATQVDLFLQRRLAQIERLRDHALDTGNEVLLDRADKMEAQARQQYRFQARGQAFDRDARVRADGSGTADSESRLRNSVRPNPENGLRPTVNGDSQTSGRADARQSAGVESERRSGGTGGAAASGDASSSTKSAGSASVTDRPFATSEK